MNFKPGDAVRYRNHKTGKVMSLDGGPLARPLVTMVDGDEHFCYLYHRPSGRYICNESAASWDIMDVIPPVPEPTMPHRVRALLEQSRAVLTRLSVETGDASAAEIALNIRTYLNDHQED